jgi:FkbM family methyltransferase
MISQPEAIDTITGVNRWGRYCVPAGSQHRPAARAILSGEVWEPDTVNFLVRHRGGGDIIHAGTYFGDFLPALSAACQDSGRVWAFEPNPENYYCALRTKQLGRLDNVVLTHAALGARRSEASVRVKDEAGIPLGGGSSIVSATTESRFTVAARVVTIDDSAEAERPVDIVQLDVEGYESEALLGGRLTIERWSPVLILEGALHEPVRRWLESLGYRPVQRLHENTVWATAAWMSAH